MCEEGEECAASKDHEKLSPLDLENTTVRSRHLVVTVVRRNGNPVKCVAVSTRVGPIDGDVLSNASPAQGGWSAIRTRE